MPFLSDEREMLMQLGFIVGQEIAYKRINHTATYYLDPMGGWRVIDHSRNVDRKGNSANPVLGYRDARAVWRASAVDRRTDPVHQAVAEQSYGVLQ